MADLSSGIDLHVVVVFVLACEQTSTQWYNSSSEAGDTLGVGVAVGNLGLDTVCTTAGNRN